MKLKRYRKHNKYLTYIIILISFFIVIGLGYSYLSTNLSISGIVNVERRRIFPTQIEDVIDNDTCMEKYEGQVTDQVGVTKTAQDVWFNNCTNKRNIIFGGYCWQMIRTTETGGIKMLYNGEPVDGKCESTRGTHKGIVGEYGKTESLDSNYLYGSSFTYDTTNNEFTLIDTFTETWSDLTYENLIGKFTCMSLNSTCSTVYYVGSYLSNTNAKISDYDIGNTNYAQVGKTTFNSYSDSLAISGYMFNKVYKQKTSSFNTNENVLNFAYINTTYWYAHSVEWGNPQADKYNLVNPYQISSSSDYPSLVGKYTFRSTDQNLAYYRVYYIVDVKDDKMYCLELISGHVISDYIETYTYGDTYTDNGNGTYTVNNPITINNTDWVTNYINIRNKYICKGSSNTCSELLYSSDTSEYTLSYLTTNNKITYSSGFSYNNNTGMYTLNNDSVVLWDLYDDNTINSFSTHHYTCWNNTGTCSTISFLNHLSSSSLSYIELKDGNSINDAINDMLYANDVNKYDSSIKAIIDSWYKQNLLSLTNKLEDTVYCNSRVISDYGSWNPNGGYIKKTFLLDFGVYGDKNLSCSNITDQFSVSNNIAKLTYPVGLFSVNEYNNVGFNANTQAQLLISNKYYWSLSPQYYKYDGLTVFAIGRNGSILSQYVSNITNDDGLRIAISLKNGITFASGSGSETDPWIVN